MKAFHFRLDQAMRWRTTQVEIEKSRVALAAQVVREIDGETHRQRLELSAASDQLRRGGFMGDSLAVWTAYNDKARRLIKSLEQKAEVAGKALADQMQLLAEANRRLQLLQNLKLRAQAGWHAEFSRELEAFAGESYLFRLQSKNARARSSGG